MPAQALAGQEPQVPIGAVWGMTLEQTQRLPELERAADGTLQRSYVIRGVNQHELIAQWKGRTVSFFIASGFGLYAMNLEMTPQTLQHTESAIDQELLDLEQCAPIRLAVLQKYGNPLGLAATWDSNEISPFPSFTNTSRFEEETVARQWPYARNWLIWEGLESRLALGEQSLWYVSRIGLVERERKKLELGKERDLSLERELERRAKRQQQIDEAREAVTSRAQAFTSSF
jgi:hypothetical protein